jgi:hypothetical protein
MSRQLVGLILIYITLDLSVASMPGAFVFDAGDSVETVHRSRTEAPARALSTLAPARSLRDVVTVVAEVTPKPHVASFPMGQLRPPIPGRVTRTADTTLPSEDSD